MIITCHSYRHKQEISCCNSHPLHHHSPQSTQRQIHGSDPSEIEAWDSISHYVYIHMHIRNDSGNILLGRHITVWSSIQWMTGLRPNSWQNFIRQSYSSNLLKRFRVWLKCYNQNFAWLSKIYHSLDSGWQGHTYFHNVWVTSETQYMFTASAHVRCQFHITCHPKIRRMQTLWDEYEEVHTLYSLPHTSSMLVTMTTMVHNNLVHTQQLAHGSVMM